MLNSEQFPPNQTQNLVISGESLALDTFIMILESSTSQLATVLFQDVKLSKGEIRLKNVALSMISAELNDVIIRDERVSSKVGHVQLSLDQSTFTCNSSQECGIYFINMPIAKVDVKGSTLTTCNMQLEVSDLFLVVSSSNIIAPSFNVTVRSRWNIPTWITLERSYFRNTLQSNSQGTRQKRQAALSPIGLNPLHNLLFKINSPLSIMSIDDCDFHSLSIENNFDHHFYPDSTAQVSFMNTTFEQSSKDSNGGAVSVLTNDAVVSVSFDTCIFTKNRVVKNANGDLGVGGAVYVDGSSATLDMKHSIFSDQFIPTIGSALYASTGVTVSIENNTFNYDIKETEPLFSVLALEGTVQRLDAAFTILNTLPENSQNNFRLISLEKVHEITINVQCPDWYRHNSDFIKTSGSTTSGNSSEPLSKLVYECLPCSDGFYTVSKETRITMATLQGNESSTVTCIECPYGARCTGNNIIPRQHYWGYWDDTMTNIDFVQCPPFYCCQGNEEAPCSRLDICAPNRTGDLCGHCVEEMSIAILTGECTPDSDCHDDYLFWMFLVPVLFAYAMWYTLKSDILYLFVKLPLKSITAPYKRAKDDRKGSKCSKGNSKDMYSKGRHFKDDKMNLSEMGIKQSQNGNVNGAAIGQSTPSKQHNTRGYFAILTNYDN